ncbi:MAG: hypothetical protein JO043_03780 [Candidatus Eremiobacteraeota bacterium]|nr:hypothetical protein [Candidatus Eremiobacteraeota bacterium]
MKAPQAGSRDVVLAVLRDVFGPARRGAQEALAYRLRRAQLSARHVAFVTELAYGTIKMRRALDWALHRYLEKRTAPLPLAIAEALRMGAYQLLYMDGVSDHAAVGETVGAALRVGHRGTAGLVNAILRRISAEPPSPPEREAFATEEDYLGTSFSVPTWIVQQWRERFAERASDVLRGVDKAPQLGIRFDRNALTVEQIVDELRVRGVSAHRSPFAFDALVADDRPQKALHDDPHGRWVLQAEAACMPVDLLDPQPGEHIADLCSGRGNKALQIASRLQGTGAITCVESDGRRAHLLQQRVTAMSHGNIAIIEGDARVARETRSDRVLLDAPCSGLGTLGRYPEARWRKAPVDGARLSTTQSALLRAAANSTKPGGRVVYSVCTTDERECENVVEGFLADHPSFGREPPPARYAPFLTASSDVLVPPGIEGRDGFYIALLGRRNGA